ncbi:MAG: lysophospholipid acyltransferase family protein [Ignavibacteriales bacterium]|nr:MAG: lysophospholipid acyltransferase family protein [Ignavibacteriales bacterium]
MIKADHKKWARFIFDIYITRELKNKFNRFILVNEFPEIEPGSSLLILPNHFSWWDGFFIDYYTKHFIKRKIHLLMLEEQLKRYWFFKKVGAYSINPDNAKSTFESLQYTAEVLNDLDNFVVYYPQGKIEQYEKRPPLFKPGVLKVLENSKLKTNVLPVGFKISYSENKLPDVFVRSGKMISVAPRENSFELIRTEFTNNLSLLDEFSPGEKSIDLFTL